MIYHVTAMRALGLFPPVADPDAEQSLGLSPGIAFNSAAGFDFDPSDGIEPNQVSSLRAPCTRSVTRSAFSPAWVFSRVPDAPLTPDVVDLFRFRPGRITFETFASAPRILSSGDEHIFLPAGGNCRSPRDGPTVQAATAGRLGIGRMIF